MKNWVLCIVAGMMVMAGHAQRPLDLVSLSFRYGFPQEYEEPYPGSAAELGSLNSITAGIRFAGKYMIPISFNHFYFNVKGEDDFPSEMVDPVRLHGFILRTGWYQRFPNGHAVQILIAPRLMSDFIQTNRRSFQLGGVFTYEKEFNEALTMSFGAIFNQELFGPYLVPLVELHWQVASRWRIDGMLPVTGRIAYKVTDQMTAGFNHFGLITSYALGGEAYGGDYMERQSIDLSLFLRQRIGWKIYAEAMAGRTFGRTYRQFARDQKVTFALPLIAFGDERTVKNVTFGDGFILTVKLLVNIPYPEW